MLNRLLIAALVLAPLGWAQETGEIRVVTVSTAPADMSKRIDEALKRAGVDAATRKRILEGLKRKLPQAVLHPGTLPKGKVMVVRRAAPVAVPEPGKRVSHDLTLRTGPGWVRHDVVRAKPLPPEISKRLDALVAAIKAHERKQAKTRPARDLSARIDRLERRLNRIEGLLERLVKRDEKRDRKDRKR